MKRDALLEKARRRSLPGLLLGWSLAIMGTMSLSVRLQAAEPALEAESALLLIQGRVEIAKAGTAVWEKAQVQQKLRPGDRLRTGERSRAAVRLGNRTVLPINESTTLTFEASPVQGGRPILSLDQGALYFRSRERPQELQFRTRLASGAVRGTEFHLAVDDKGYTLLTLFDGEVELHNAFGQIALRSGEQAQVEPGKAPHKTAAIAALNVIQWVLYYPGILDLRELDLNAAEQLALAASLAADRQGDVLQALAQYPSERTPGSDAERVYLAALLLAVGQVDEAQELLRQKQGVGNRERGVKGEGQGAELGRRAALLAEALQKLIAAVQGQAPAELRRPETATGLATEWLAESYYQQSRGQLAESLRAAQEATARSDSFGFAWVRRAELEFSFGRTAQAVAALDKGLELSPRNAAALTLRGFLLSARNRTAEALNCFEDALAVDGALGHAWLGRGLCQIRLHRAEAGRQDLQMAAALEPQRALFRSYLGKAFVNEKDFAHARLELDRAKQLDPNDPTAWLYSALLNQQENQVNEAITDLEKSQELNENRRIYRSRLLLDQDRAVRGANLAGIYQDARLTEVSLREAARAVDYDYANYSSHLFLADSYNALRDPRQVNLRYETPWLSEFLMANLLAPVGSGTLSQYISQNEYSRFFARDRMGLSSSTEYLSGGDWTQSGSQFGTFGNSSYALDALYRSENGQRRNDDLRQLTFSAKVKEQLTPQDSVYVKALYYDAESGDVAQYYDPQRAQPQLRVKETQEPILLAGYHHEWAPGHHSLFLAGRLQDTLAVADPDQPVLLLGKNAAGDVILAPKPALPLAPMEYQSDFEAYTLELQQIAQQEKGTLVAGSRYQIGGFDTESRLGRSAPTRLGNNTVTVPVLFVSPAVSQAFSTDLQRISLYSYYQRQVWEPLSVSAGLSYDRLTYPLNYRVPPLVAQETTQDQVSPKAGLIWTPLKHTTLRASYTRSLGGVSYDQSFRLEPTQVAGFNQAYRSLISESLFGATASPTFDLWGLALDQRLGQATYLTVAGEWLESDVDRRVGAMDVAGLPPATTFTASSTRQLLDYQERNLRLILNQLLGRFWSAGVQYRLGESDLLSRFPEIPSAVTPAAHADQTAVLHQISLFTQFNHASGFFSSLESRWSRQSNQGYSPDIPGDDFWQLDAFAGYRFWRRQMELKLGVLNLTDQDYRLNPLNLYPEYRRDRTFVLSCKLYF